MKLHAAKNRDKTRAKRRGVKIKDGKKPNWKGEKSNKMLSQKSEKGREKTWQKNNKREGTEDQGSDIWIVSFHSLLFNASSLVMQQSFKSLFTNFSHVKFGLPLPLFSLSVRLITPLWIGAFTDLHWKCLNQLKWWCTRFSSTGVIPSLLCMSSFQTRSFFVWP
jgi:hypothetical protein